MTRPMPLQRKDFDRWGNLHHVIWWLEDAVQDWSTPWLRAELREQVRGLGPYICRGVGRALVSVDLCWNAPLECVQVESYAEMRELRGPSLGKRYAHFRTVPEAIRYAREEVRRLHRWLESDGQMVLPQPPAVDSSLPARPVAEVQREIARLEARQQARSAQAGTGSKATIASRNARREWDGERLHRLRQELTAQPAYPPPP